MAHLKKSPKLSKSSDRFGQCRRMNAFNCENNSSMGFRPGEYGDKKRRITPAWSQSSLIDEPRWKDALSITRTELGSGHRPHSGKRFLMKFSNTSPSVDPWKISVYIIPFCVYAGSIWCLCSRWKLAVWTAGMPRGAQPVRRTPASVSHPDSSTKTS